MGMQVSCGVDTEVPEEDTVWGIADVSGKTFRDLAVQQECNIIEGNLLPYHVNTC
jgi:hypothetical protein